MGFGWCRSERSTRQELDDLRSQIRTKQNQANVDYYAPIPPNDYYSK
jgi:septin family protein